MDHADEFENVAAMVAAYVENDFSDDDRDGWEKISVNIEEFLLLGDTAFRRHFRLSKPQFEVLCEDVAGHLFGTGLRVREKTPFRGIMLMGLWILATLDSYRSVALRFGVHPGDVHEFYKHIIAALRDIGPRYVTWPNRQERHRIKRSLQRISGYPGIVGMLDGSHIPIPAPKDEPAAYRNRHHQHSILAQAVCDDRLLVRDIYVGEAGSLHDARVFRRSPLCRNLLQRPREMFDRDEHIVGDSAYMLLDKVMTPFEKNGHLQLIQRNHNRRLSRCRVRIEHAFGRLKCIWRRMQFLPVRNMEYAVDHVVASFVLHNFRILNGEKFPECNEGIYEEPGEPSSAAMVSNISDRPRPGVDDVIPDDNVPQGDLAVLLQQAHLRGEQKRWDICNELPMNDEM